MGSVRVVAPNHGCAAGFPSNKATLEAIKLWRLNGQDARCKLGGNGTGVTSIAGGAPGHDRTISFQSRKSIISAHNRGHVRQVRGSRFMAAGSAPSQNGSIILGSSKASTVGDNIHNVGGEIH